MIQYEGKIETQISPKINRESNFCFIILIYKFFLFLLGKLSNASTFYSLITKESEETKEMLKYLWYYAAWNCTLPLKDLDARYPVEKLVTPENSVPYCIYQLEAEKRMFVFFDDTIDLLRQIVAVFISNPGAVVVKRCRRRVPAGIQKRPLPRVPT